MEGKTGLVKIAWRPQLGASFVFPSLQAFSDYFGNHLFSQYMYGHFMVKRSDKTDIMPLIVVTIFVC